MGKAVLRKHVGIIHAFSTMTVLQRKAFNFLLHEADKQRKIVQDSGYKSLEFVTRFSEFKKAIGFKSNNNSYLRESVDELASLKIEWNVLKDRIPMESFLNMRILHGAPTFSQDGNLYFSFHKAMFRLIGSPEIYGTIDIDRQAEFGSRYSHALYENGTRFVNMTKKKVIRIEDFRKILGVEGDKYKSTKDLNKFVIKSAVEEVNDISDFVVSLEPIRSGQRLSGFDISVDTKHRIPDDLEEIDKYNEVVKRISKDFGKIGGDIIKKTFLAKGEEYVFKKIQYTKENTQRDKSGLYPAGYLVSALKNDWDTPVNLVTESRVITREDKEASENKLNLMRLQQDVRHWERMIDYDKSNKYYLSSLESSRERLNEFIRQDNTTGDREG